MNIKIPGLICVAALALSSSVVFAGSSSDQGVDKPKMAKDHEKAKNKNKPSDEHDGREQAAARGAKEGWVDGQPRGQAKKFGKGNPQHKTSSAGDGHTHHDGDNGENHGPEHGSGGSHPPATSEEILTEIAKGEAARRVGGAPGSAEEALINIGADAILERAKQR